MSEPTNNSGAEPDVTPDLRLRPERPRVTRLSRKVLIGLGAVSRARVAGALSYALQTRNTAAGRPGALQHGEPPDADGPRALPQDYTGLPRKVPPLGPPLPGDLGRPILNAQQRRTRDPASMPNSSGSPRKPRRRGTSRLFAQTEPAVAARVGNAVAERVGRDRRRRRPRRRRSIPTPPRTCRTASSPS